MNNQMGIFYLTLAVVALAFAIVLYPTLKYGPKEEKRKTKTVVKKSSKKKK
jgi:hypothetical protein